MKKVYVAIMLIIGLGLLTGGLVYKLKISKFLSTATQVEAKITNIAQSGTRKRRTHTVSFEFNAIDSQGESMRIAAKTTDYHYGMEVGGKMIVYYNPEDPREIRTPSTPFLVYLLLGFGAFCTLVALLVLKSVMKIAKLKARLVPLNNSVMASVTKVSGKLPLIETVLDIMDKMFRQLTLEYSVDGKDYKVKSPYMVLSSEAGVPDQVKVYFDPSDPKICYIDEDSLS